MYHGEELEKKNVYDGVLTDDSLSFISCLFFRRGKFVDTLIIDFTLFTGVGCCRTVGNKL